jgi:hypothetical protein
MGGRGRQAHEPRAGAAAGGAQGRFQRLARIAAFAAARQGLALLLGALEQFLHGVVVVFVRLAHLDGQRPLRAMAQAGPKPVAVAVRDHLGLAIHDDQGALGAVRHAQSAAVALLLVDPDYFSSDSHMLLQQLKYRFKFSPRRETRHGG